MAQKKNTIINDSVIANRKFLTKNRPSKKYNELFSALLAKFREARGKGHHVNFNWLWSKARVIYRNQLNDETAVVKKHVITTFLKRYNIRMRCRQRNKKLPKEAFREDLRKWHAIMRERLLRTGLNDSYDNKWGRFKPNQRFNVDQTPMPFVVNTKRTYEELQKNHEEKIWISQPGSGLDKRQCTVQMLTRADGEQPRIAIIFRGTGKSIREDEKASWHPGVDVYWQPSAWADTAFSLKWAENTLAHSVNDLNRFVLFLDNLPAQETNDFKNAVASLNGVVWFGLKNATDLWQVVDAGLGQMLKVLVAREHQIWLDQEENAERWYGNNSEPFGAMERRILITHWVGEAWKALCGPNYDHFRRRCWEKTGCLMTADGSHDEKIKPEGLPNYQVKPPLDMFPVAETHPTPNNAVGSDTVSETEDIDLIEELAKEVPENEGEEYEDNQDDRIENAPYCGRKLRALYENGWFEGDIDYYNVNICRYHVLFHDGSEDYIGEDDIDMTEVIVF